MRQFPEWTPKFVRPVLDEMDIHPLTSGPRRAIFELVVADPRMRSVYDELLRKDRKTGAFLHPCRNRPDGVSAENAQLAAIRDLLRLVITAARDKIQVSKKDEIEAAKVRWSDDARRLRALANDFGHFAKFNLFGIDTPEAQHLMSQEVEIARRFADRLDHLTLHMRGSDDPLVVERHRGDPIVRGVQIMISLKLEELFGDGFHGTAATLTSVVLEVETTPRVSRSALTGKTAK